MKMAGDHQGRVWVPVGAEWGHVKRQQTGLQKIPGSKGVNTKTGMYRVVVDVQGGGCGRKQQ